MSYLTKFCFLLMASVLIIAGLYILIDFPAVFEGLSSFVERHISLDHHIREKKDLARNIYWMAAVLLIIGAIMLASLKDSFRSMIKEIVLTDHACQSNSIVARPLFFLLVSSLGGILLVALYMAQRVLSSAHLYFEGPFETFSTLALAVSTVFVCIAALNLRKKSKGGLEKDYRWASRFYLVLAVMFFLVVMEEISWGQRIFGWETPSLLAQKNYQEETNIHNFFNPYFQLLYRLPALLLVPVLAAAWLKLRHPKTKSHSLILPHPSMIVLGGLIAFFSVGLVKNELLEELIYLFVFLYSLRAVICSRSLARIPHVVQQKTKSWGNATLKKG